MLRPPRHADEPKYIRLWLKEPFYQLVLSHTSLQEDLPHPYKKTHQNSSTPKPNETPFIGKDKEFKPQTAKKSCNSTTYEY